MADKKISELVNLTSLAADDEFVVVDKGANATKRITATNLSKFPSGVTVPDAGTIGSASDPDAMAISSGGVVNFTQQPTVTGDDVYHQGNILGTVSESSGDPTGAVIERDSNANGEYVKFADGTMICHHVISFTTNTSSFLGRKSPQVSWTFPAQFRNVTEGDWTVIGTASNTNNQFFCIPAGPGSTTSTNLRMYRIDSNNDITRELRVKAIGRWY